MPVTYFGDHELTKDYFLQQLVHSPPPVISVDVETISLKERLPIGFSIATSPSESWYFRTYPEHDPEVELVMPLLQNPSIKKVFHNAPFDLRAFPLIGEIDTSNIADTNVMARLLGRRATKLVELAYEVGMSGESVADMLKPSQTMLDLNWEDVANKCANDTRVTLALYYHYLPQIDQEYFAVEMAAIPILIDMSLRGMKIDQDGRAELEAKYTKDVEYYRNLCLAENFNPNSPQQVGYILAKRGNFLPMTKSKKQLKASVEELEFLDDPMASIVLAFRHSNTFLTRYIIPLKGEDRIYTEYNLDAVVGRISSSNRNLQNIPPEARFIFVPDSGTFTTGDFCLAPNTLVLKSDLSWERIDCLDEGDELVGIEESPLGGKGKRRKLLKTKVKRLALVEKESYRITMTDGRVIEASGEHPWLVMDEVWRNSVAQHPEWRITSDITPGTRMRQICNGAWEQDFSYDAAYIAGFFDGEGWVDKSYHMVGFGQNEGATLDLVVDKLHDLGFSFNRSKGSSSTTVQYRLTHLSEMLRFIGTIRPPRLLEKSDYLWVGYEPPKLEAWAEVESIENIGAQELVAIETDSHTFIAEGLFTHNSQEHLRIIAWMSQDRQMLRVFEEGEMGGDIHMFTAKEMNISRRVARNVNYAIPYGATPKALSLTTKIRDVRKCSNYLDRWFTTFPDAAEWIKGVQMEGLRDGWALPTMFGRRIRIPEDEDVESQRRKAINYPVLGSDGEVMKRALIACHQKGLPLVVCVHDSITCDGDIEFPIDELENLSPVHLPFEVKRTYRWE